MQLAQGHHLNADHALVLPTFGLVVFFLGALAHLLMCAQTNRHTLQLALCGGSGGCGFIIYRSRCRDNGRLYTVPKFYRHTASVSRGQIYPIDPLAGTSRWDLNPIDPLAGTSRSYVFNTIKLFICKYHNGNDTK